MTAKQRGEYRTDEGRERSEYNIGQRGSRQQICKQTAERYARYRRRCKYRQGAERLGDAYLNNAGGKRRGSIGYRGVERGVCGEALCKRKALFATAHPYSV